MYSITVINSTGEYALHNTYDEDLKVIQPVLELELNKSGTLTFSIDPTHPNRAQILPMASEIYVYDDDRVYWIGRPLTIDGDWDNIANVTCEGILGYLLDTQIPPFDFTEGNSIRGTNCVRTFLDRLLSRHYSDTSGVWADIRKRFTTGTVTVTDSNNNLARSSEDYHSTLDTINEKLIEPYGGYIRPRWNTSNGLNRYIDYIETFGAATQQIVFGENLLDLSTHTNADEIYTAVIPEGAQIGDTDERLTLDGYKPSTAVYNQIKSLTHGGGLWSSTSYAYLDGSTYIYDSAGVVRHGRVFIKQTWDDITTQENLALKAAKYIGEISVLGTTIELSAIDLSRISVDYKRFNLGEIVQVISLPHDVNAEYQITQMTVDLYDPSNSTMVLGGKLGTYTFDNTKQTSSIENTITDILPAAIQNATALLSGGLGGYLIIRQDDNGQPYEILIMNAATEAAATRCVRMNQNGIGFGRSSAGSTDWTYRNAWTIDGNLIADFITTGTLKDAAGNTQFNLSTGQFTMKKGSINLGGGSFSVDNNGSIFSKNGNIGGFNISADGLWKVVNIGSKKVYAGFNSPKKFTDNVIYITSSGNSAFSVSASGKLYCVPLKSDGAFGPYMFLVENNGITLQGADASIKLESKKASMYSTTSGAWVETNNNGLTLIPGRSTTVHSGNLYLDAAGRAYRGVDTMSSRTIKHDIKPVENDKLDPERLYDLDVVQFKYNDDILSEDDQNRGKDLIGFIIEDLDEIFPSVVAKDDPEDPKTWTWSQVRMLPAMLQLIKNQKKQIDSLEDRLAKLEATVEKLKGENNG